MSLPKGLETLRALRPSALAERVPNKMGEEGLEPSIPCEN